MAMDATIADIIEAMEALAPARLAESWDSVGLQVGDRAWPVKRIWTALDAAPHVVAAACREGVDLLVTHHPLLFRPLKSLDLATPIGASIADAVRHQLGIFSSHTNLDSAAGGLNDLLAANIGLADCRVLGAPATAHTVSADGQENPPDAGLGRVGRLETPTTLENLARRVKERFGLRWLRSVGDPQLPVERAAVCSGSGSGLLAAFFASGAQVYVSGDLGYHDARAVEEAGLGLIDIGHFASEHIVVEDLAGRLDRQLKTAGFRVEVIACGLERDPFSPVT